MQKVVTRVSFALLLSLIGPRAYSSQIIDCIEDGTCNVSSSEGLVVTDSRVYIMEHSHLNEVSKTLKSDNMHSVAGVTLNKAKNDLISTLNQLAVNASPSMKPSIFAIVNNAKVNIDSLSQSELASKLVVLADFSHSLDQNELALRANSILQTIAPKSSQFLNQDLKIPLIASYRINYNNPLRLYASPKSAVEKYFGGNGSEIEKELFSASNELNMGFQSKMANMGFDIEGKSEDNFSLTSHVSGYRFDQSSYISLGGDQKTGKFTPTDRIVAGFTVGFGGILSGSTAGAGIGTFVGGPAGTTGGALIGGSAGFVSGFMVGYNYPLDNFANGKSIEKSSIVEMDLESRTIRTTSKIKVVDHKTGNTDESGDVKVEKMTILPQDEKPGVPIDGPNKTPNDGCGGGACPKTEVIGCDAPPDYGPDSSSNDRAPLTEAEILEIKQERRNLINPLILTDDLESFLKFRRLTTESTNLKDLIEIKDGLINWGIEGQNVKSGSLNFQRIDPLVGPRPDERLLRNSNISK